MEIRNTVDYIKLFFKGVFMGIADAIPGVSGGTIALLLGIYEELISTISGLNFSLVTKLKNNGFKSFWESLNGNFLITLVLGIGISLILFVKISANLLTSHPLYVWSFFLGLILATVYVIYKLIESWNLVNIISTLLMIAFSIILTSDSLDISDDTNLFYILICGIIASSAMILPGISGSLILVILGVYKILVEALDNLDIKIISSFIVGAIIGVISFSKILKWLFRNYKSLAYSIMLGLVIGSIEKIWPWNKSFSAELSNLDLFVSISLVILGFIIVFLLEKRKKLNDRK
jgi:putative membrane protein